MSNLFDGAKLGDKFKKNDGEMAVYVSYDAYYKIHSLYDEKYSILVNDDGTSIHTNWIDIVSRWEEPNNEKLVKNIAQYAKLNLYATLTRTHLFDDENVVKCTEDFYNDILNKFLKEINHESKTDMGTD